MQAELETTLLADKFMAELSARARNADDLRLFLRFLPVEDIADVDAAFATGSNLELSIDLQTYMDARSISVDELRALKGLNHE